MSNGGDDTSTIDALEQVAPRERRVTATQIAGLASIGAGAVHAAAVGIHAEHATLSRLFVLAAVAQIAVGLLALIKGGRANLTLAVLVNGSAVVAWAVTRTAGISWIEGLEQAEDAQFADTACALLGGLAAGAALVALARHRTTASGPRLGLPSVAIGAFAVFAMLAGAGHAHSGSEAEEAAGGHHHGGATEAAAPAADAAAAADGPDPTTGTAVDAEAASPAGEGAAEAHAHDATATPHAHDEAATGTETETASTETAAAWPRPFDPTQPIDFSGVPGVTPEQQARAEQLVRDTMRDLPAFADVATLPALGYRSIGDSATGFEHYINYGYIADDAFLDPTKPESLVFRVDGDARTLVSAMFIGKQTAIDDPALVGYGGPLMQWHVHQNLCWAGTDDGPKVVGVVDAAGNCPPGSVNAGGDSPMVHVWITPHECGPFAALEGHGAGQTDPDSGVRTDQCAHGATDGHDGHDTGTSTAAPTPYDPTQPIDLGGTPGVTPEQQAFAENLVARTVVDLPQWADPAAAEAAGFHSIGDAPTGHEHYIQWDWINDDVWLDPDAPESLVYAPQPDGSKQLVSAMYMLPDTMTLDQVPDLGGALMQWHIHDNLCFTSDPVAPLVRGVTNADGTCSAPLVKLGEAPMIHVWITPNECGPFAALEGLGAGSPPEGEETLCDHAHGSTGTFG